jgi:hypothetical protein
MMDKPTKEQYQVARARAAISFAPEMYPCKKCGWPVLNGYCCNTCGDTNPSEEEIDKAKEK